jgi:hypothetical protein
MIAIMMNTMMKLPRSDWSMPQTIFCCHTMLM